MTVSIFDHDVQSVPENEQRIPGIYAYVGKTTKDEWTIKIGKAIDQTIYDRNEPGRFHPFRVEFQGLKKLA